MGSISQVGESAVRDTSDPLILENRRHGEPVRFRYRPRKLRLTTITRLKGVTALKYPKLGVIETYDLVPMRA